MGATLALAVAAERPALVDSLTIISAPLYCDGWNVSLWRRFSPLLYYTPLWRLCRPRERFPFGVKNKPVRALIAARHEHDGLASWRDFAAAALRLREADRPARQVRRSLGQVQCPTPMIHARDDDVASLANVRYVQTHLGTDQFAEVIVENSHHLIVFDDYADFAATKTIQFINSRARFTGVALGNN